MSHDIGTLDSVYEYQTRVFCIISDQRVFRSKSPEMFSAVFRRTGIKGAYVPFMVDAGDIGKALNSLRVLNIAGANITAPFKESVLAYLDVLSEGANIIGAVNTIVCKGGQLKGYNTNAIGIMDALNAVGFDIAGKKALVIGTGGAARAVVFILNWLRAESIIVAGRDAANTERMADHFQCTPRSLADLADFPVSADIVVNATPISSRDEEEPLTDIAKRMNPVGCQLVFDLNYGARDNIWQAMAADHNVRFLDGLSTLAYQARRTFLLWTGQEVPQDEFAKALSP
ncbi:shikimate dehydrogenase family protein [Desulfosarcina ovata]|uniref:shikimate dehydrogenase (NADP(+)) n=1 Tax=Desulfosarcina ovata subsp. ovata TaxID=2752305 RepID=A0A5K8AAY0_9BACT|nr:shikimate dehydrogenase [Desulfosarcina ovata]BBO89765.1 shikimate dehydrogenase (NADP(+)) [Desulfosarcina ovata subsp. ovata]